jgi:methylmalonyl-CoA carboxyltransferase large subunit
MKPPADWAQVVERLEAIQRELTRLGERVQALEALSRGQESGVRGQESGGGSSLTPDPCPLTPENEELILVISAAIAAFLGKRPHIRQIRLLGSAAWAQQGRVTIQASHALGAHHR